MKSNLIYLNHKILAKNINGFLLYVLRNYVGRNPVNKEIPFTGHFHDSFILKKRLFLVDYIVLLLIKLFLINSTLQKSFG